MLWLLVPKFALLLLAGAIALEFAGRNASKRPFSRHSLNKRRWDDPNNKDKLDAAVPSSLSCSGIMLGHENFYLISKDPAVQTKLLSGPVSP
ncbi:hypothetical protein A9Q94_20560 [Rhodobacterales bacterium 56_14_T64]|nr:hypothetical protein A9Q94_20560 [Rhodobacterales bacterium 56_14_T64]